MTALLDNTLRAVWFDQGTYALSRALLVSAKRKYL